MLLLRVGALRAALAPVRCGALSQAMRAVPMVSRHLCTPAVSESSSSSEPAAAAPIFYRNNRSSRKVQLEAALEVARLGGEFVYPTRADAPSTLPGPCYAVTSTLEEVGEPLTTKELFAAVEEKWPGALNSVHHLKHKVLKKALVNNVVKVRYKDSTYKQYWAMRKPGQIRMTIARRDKNRSKEISHLDTRRDKDGKRVKPGKRWPPRKWFVRIPHKKSKGPAEKVFRPMPGQEGYVEG